MLLGGGAIRAAVMQSCIHGISLVMSLRLVASLRLATQFTNLLGGHYEKF